MLGNKAAGSPAALRRGPGGAGAAWSPCPSLLVPCLPACLQPPLQKPLSSDLDFRCLAWAHCCPGGWGWNGSRAACQCGGREQAGFPQEHHNHPQQHLAEKPHWLFSTQTNTLEVNCLCHACASTLLASGEAAGPEGRAHHSLAVWPETGRPTFMGLASTQCL